MSTNVIFPINSRASKLFFGRMCHFLDFKFINHEPNSLSAKVVLSFLFVDESNKMCFFPKNIGVAIMQLG